MNDRHRTIERWKKKQAARNKHQNEFFLNDLGKAVLNLCDAITQTMSKAMKLIKDFSTKIKTMPEDEFQKKLEEFRPQLTDEQIKLLHKIRGDGNNDKPNSEA